MIRSKNLFKSIVGVLIYFITQSTISAQSSQNKFPQNGQRYLAWNIINFDDIPEHNHLDLINLAAQNGCNAVCLGISWYNMYRTPTSTPYWKKIDDEVALCVKLGLKIAFRIHAGQAYYQLKSGFWDEKYCMVDLNDQPNRGVYDQTTFSFSYQPAVDKAKGYIKEVCERYNYLQQQGHILWVAVTNTPTQELGYSHENWPNGDYSKAQEQLYDLSDISKAAFVNWTKRKYGKIERLNARWGRDFESFEKVHPPSAPWEPKTGFTSNWGHDWYVFRHLQLKNFIEQTTSTIRQVNPNYKVIFEQGSVTDEISSLRGSLSFKDLIQNLDGIKINDAATYDSRFTTDVVRSNTPIEKWVMNEAECPSEQPVDLTEKQINRAFEHGANLVTMFISSVKQFELYKDIMRRMSEKWTKSKMDYIPPTISSSYTLSRILDFNYKGAGIYDEWLNKGGKDDKKVDIRLIEDLLTDTLQGTLNRTPVVKNLIPNRAVKQGRFFSYKVAPEVFYDPDGIITKIEARGMPSWMSYKDNTFFGTPPEPGSFVIVIRATDDEGAAIETQFTITVDIVEPRINQKPIQKKTISDTVVLYKQSFRYKIPDDTFLDPDGFIGRIEIMNQPSWLQIKSTELYGTATEVGVFKIIVRAYDDDEASIETSFNIKVIYPEINLALAGAGEPIKRVRIQEIKDNDIIAAQTLPNLVNIYVNCTAQFNRMELTLKGPLNKFVSVTSNPFALFQSSEGFVPLSGDYELKTSIYQSKELITESKIKFKIANIDPTTGKIVVLNDWAGYPNPTHDYFIIKLPDNEDVSTLRFTISTLLGHTIEIPNGAVTLADKTAYISLNTIQIPPGSYILKTMRSGSVLNVKKIIVQ